MRGLIGQETQQLLRDLGIETSQASAFTTGGFVEPISYDWHVHKRHQLIYAFSGTLAVEGNGRRHLIPLRHAAFIPANLPHRTTLGFSIAGRQSVRSKIVSVFTKPRATPVRTDGIAVFGVTPLLAEMLGRALEWGPDHKETALSKGLFRTLALLCAEGVAAPIPFWLPQGNDPKTQEVLRWLDAHLRDANETKAAAEGGVSVRTFRRQFAAGAGMPWRECIVRARLLRAAEELAAASSKSVAEIAWHVGYASAPAFAKAFQKFTGQTPGEYRRLRAGDA